MTVVAGMLVAPGFSTQAVNEEIVKQSPEQFFGYTWDGNSYPMPTSIGVAPGFVPFNDIFANTLKNSSSTVLTNSKGADIGVEITKDQSDTQSGSIWNTPGNELDLTKSFSATMQFYLGKEGKTESGDGIAFVMAKDQPADVYPGGGALGIWGNLTTKTADGMPNSFAVAIDTNANADYKWDTAVYNSVKYSSTAETDYILSNGTSINQNYIAWGYPGMENQYRVVKHTSYDALNNKTIEHNKMLAFATGGSKYESVDGSTTGVGEFDLVPQGALNNGAWHQMDIKYVREGDGGTFTYTITLKNPNGTPSGTEVTRSIHWSDAQIQSIFGSTKLNWGFTAATGDKFENGVVAFQNIPGLLDNSFASSLVGADKNELTHDVYLEDKYDQAFLIEYHGATSRQSWPAAADGTLSAILKTGSNYGFIVDPMQSMTAEVNVQSVKGDYTLRGVAINPTTVVLKNGQTVVYARELRVQGIHRQNMADTNDWGQILTAKTIATQLGPAETIDAGTVGGDNGTLSTTADMPAVKERPLSLDAVPSFEFPKLTVAQVVGGFTGLSNTAANADALKQSGIVMQLPQDAQFTLTANLPSFDLGSDYVAGSSSIKFDFAKGDSTGKQTVTLPDNGEDTPIYTGTQTPNSTAVTNVTLNMAPYPKVKVGNYGKEGNITWTLTAAP